MSNYRGFGGYVVAICVSLSVGFFGGREYMRYELRTALQTAAAGLFDTSQSSRVQQASIPPARAPTPAAFSPISVSLVEKGFTVESYDSSITFSLAVKNIDEKDIRALDGVAEFLDLLGNHIISVTVAMNEPILVSDVITWSGEFKYNQFIDEHRRLKLAEQQNIQLIFKPRKILYTDGSTRNLGAL